MSDHWLETLDDDASEGLWKYCINSPSGSVCEYSGMNVDGSVHFARAFMIFGLFPASISSILLFVLFFRSAIGAWPISIIVMMSSHIAGICLWAALSVFTGNSWPDKHLYYGWSLIVGWICPVLYHVTGELARRIIIYELI